MNVWDVSLSIYAFGYAAGFIQDDRAAAAPPVVTLANLAALAREYGLGGIEFPIDRYFPIARLDTADDFVGGLLRDGMRVAVDLESFDVDYVRALLPLLSRNNLGWARIKMSGFYGGNRYEQPDFAEMVAAFVARIRALLPDLRAHGAKLLIENHQDLGAEDLVAIISATSADRVGINWDVGNSLAVLDTPDSFLRKAGGFIGNVHLKDYRVFRSDRGFHLSRCALGEGIVDFPRLLTGLRCQQGAVPMAIELGAQATRHAAVFEPAYWEAYRPYTVREAIEFFAFLNRQPPESAGWQTVWERRRPGREVIEAEKAEMSRSVAYLQGLTLGW